MTSLSALPKGLDRAGFIVSSACAVHCAVMPIVAGLLPLVGFEFIASETTEVIILGGTLLLALVSLAGGCRHHKRAQPLLMVTAGFALILSGHLLLETIVWAEASMVVTGALLIACAHVANWRLCCGLPSDPAPRARRAR